MDNRINRWDIINIIFIITFGICFYMCAPWISGLGGDAGDGHYALWAACAKMWHNGEVPLWNAYQWGGYSTVGSIQAVFYPVLIALEFIFWDSSSQMLLYSVFPAYIAIHFCIGASGIYVLGRARGKLPFISLVVAMLVTASGCFTYGTVWAYIFGSYCWIAWLIWALYKLVNTRRKRWIAISGCFLAMIGLSSCAHGTLFAVLIYFAIYGVIVWNKRKDLLYCVKLGIDFFVSGIIGIGIASIELLPFFEMSINAFRYIPGLALEENSSIKVPLSLFKEDVVNVDSINGVFGSYNGVIAISIVALLLIIIGFFAKKQSEDWIINFSKIFMSGCFLYIIGFGVADIFWYIPGFNAIREPILYAPFVIMVGGILMFEGADITYNLLIEKDYTLKNAVDNSNVCKWFLVLVLGISLLPHMYCGSLNILEKLLIISIIVIITIKRKCNKQIVILMGLAIVVLDLSQWVVANTNSFFYNGASATEKISAVNVSAQDVVKELDLKIEDGTDTTAKFLKWSSTEVLPPNVSSVIGSRDCFAYLNPIYEKNYFVYQYLDLVKKCQLQNIKYILFGADAEDTFTEWIESVMGKKSEIADTKVFPSYDATESKKIRYIDTSDLNLGAAWMVNEIVEYSDSAVSGKASHAETFIVDINSTNFDLSKKAYVDVDSVDMENSLQMDSGEIRWQVLCTEFSSNNIEYEVDTNLSGILVTSEFYYPGWKVKVDGKKADILQVDYACRGVRVEAGVHNVEFYYMPNSLVLGCLWAIIGILLLVLTVIMDKKENTICEGEH